MKQGIKILVGSLVLASALIACGKKGGSSAAAPATSANIGCVPNGSGGCANAGYGVLGVAEGRGAIRVSNAAKYQQFLLDNGLCSGMQIQQYPNFRRPGLPCNAASTNFKFVIKSVDNEPLPKAVNFNLTARISGYEVALAGGNTIQQFDRYGRPYGGNYGRNSMTSADIDGLGNGGYVLEFLRGGFQGQAIRPFGVGPTGVPLQPIAQQNVRLTVVLNPVDATRTIFTAVVSYQGVQIGTGQFYFNGMGNQVAGAPEVAPYYGR